MRPLAEKVQHLKHNPCVLVHAVQRMSSVMPLDVMRWIHPPQTRA